MENKIEQAKGRLERLFGGITRERGFTNSMPDEKVLESMERAGMRWDDARKTWVNVTIEKAIQDGCSPSEIWGQ